MSLSFQFIGNACGIFTGGAGTKILCDPWLVDGVFEGSWCHYPPIQTKPLDVENVDAVYVSHLHPDHFDERHFNFDKDKPLVVLDHGPNFLSQKLESLGYRNLIKVRDRQTATFRELELTLFAPFERHIFHKSDVGNLIDSALAVSDGSVTAINFNDNTPSLESAKYLYERYGSVDLAMLNYNAAGPYPSCFDNLSLDEKRTEHRRILNRNMKHLLNVSNALRPKRVLPFAGAYVLGGSQAHKNEYLGTTTWDECAAYLNERGVDAVTLREGDTIDIALGVADRVYEPVDLERMREYIANNLAQVSYPHEMDEMPDEEDLIRRLEQASLGMRTRAERLDIRCQTNVLIAVGGEWFAIYPQFQRAAEPKEPYLKCSLDPRLLSRILDRKAHWNNAEIGAHIDFYRWPNEYEVDVHTALQFLHI